MCGTVTVCYRGSCKKTGTHQPLDLETKVGVHAAVKSSLEVARDSKFGIAKLKIFKLPITMIECLVKLDKRTVCARLCGKGELGGFTQGGPVVNTELMRCVIKGSSVESDNNRDATTNCTSITQTASSLRPNLCRQPAFGYRHTVSHGVLRYWIESATFLGGCTVEILMQFVKRSKIEPETTIRMTAAESVTSRIWCY